MKSLLLLLAAVVTLSAGDLSGPWTGTMEKVKGGPYGPPIEDYHLTLKQSGDAITGTVGPENADFEILKPALSGSKLTFEISVGEFVIAFDLEVKGDAMSGTMESRKGSPEIFGKLQFKRDKR